MSWSITTVADSTAAACTYTSRKRSLDVEKAKPPMKSSSAIAASDGSPAVDNTLWNAEEGARGVVW